MSRALVIKGVNFYENKLDTVTLQEIIPCTNIALSQSSLSFTAIGQTAQLTASVVPVDTTDRVVWNTTDANCVTVADGLVTCVGVGSATITVSCGTKTASCEVTATVTLDMSTIAVVPQKILTSTDLDLVPPKDYFSLWNSSQRMTFYSTVPTVSGLHLWRADVFDGDAYPIMLPANARNIKVTLPSGLSFYNGKCYFQCANSTTEYTYNLKPKNAVKSVTNIIEVTATENVASYDIPQIEELDSFAFCIPFTQTMEEKPDGIVVTIS